MKENSQAKRKYNKKNKSKGDLKKLTRAGETLPEVIKEKKEIKKSDPLPAEIISSLVLKGDIRSMSPSEKVKYYTALCKSLGLNPLTQPFQILNLQGRETLYATKNAAEQLRTIHGVSIDKIEQHFDRDICITTITVKDKTGRTDGAIGAVSVKGLSGEQLSNAIMKSETKSKRRATLSICSLGMLDETEIETIPGASTSAFGVLVSEDKNEPVVLIKNERITDVQEAGTEDQRKADALAKLEALPENIKEGFKILGYTAKAAWMFSEKFAWDHGRIMKEINIIVDMKAKNAGV